MLVMLAVIFIPMILDDTTHTESTIADTNIPARPEADFSSRMVPLAEPAGNEQQTPAATPVPTATEPVAVTPAPIEPAADATAVETAPVTEAAPAEIRTTGKEDLGLTAWVVQLGSFSSEENAESLNKELRQAGFAAFVEPLKQDNSLVYRVRVGPELLRADAEKLQSQLLAKLKLESIIVVYP
ncbi:MAG: hypothetical protein HW386_316 [Gammaproteobacteria bacterium]|nr:hypothetical protein [Gammaproteobacteria bacterium]